MTRDPVLDAEALQFLPKEEVLIKTKKELKRDIDKHRLAQARRKPTYLPTPHPAERATQTNHPSENETLVVLKRLGEFFEDDRSELATLVRKLLQLEARLYGLQKGQQLFTSKEHDIITTSYYEKVRGLLNPYYMQRNEVIKELLKTDVLDSSSVTFFEHQQKVLFNCLNHLTQNKVGK